MQFVDIFMHDIAYLAHCNHSQIHMVTFKRIKFYEEKIEHLLLKNSKKIWNELFKMLYLIVLIIEYGS